MTDLSEVVFQGPDYVRSRLRLGFTPNGSVMQLRLLRCCSPNGLPPGRLYGQPGGDPDLLKQRFHRKAYRARIAQCPRRDSECFGVSPVWSAQRYQYAGHLQPATIHHEHR